MQEKLQPQRMQLLRQLWESWYPDKNNAAKDTWQVLRRAYLRCEDTDMDFWEEEPDTLVQVSPSNRELVEQLRRKREQT